MGIRNYKPTSRDEGDDRPRHGRSDEKKPNAR